MTEMKEFERICAFQVIYDITEKVKTGRFSSEEKVVAYDVKCGLVQSIENVGSATWGNYDQDCRPEICPLFKLLRSKT